MPILVPIQSWRRVIASGVKDVFSISLTAGNLKPGLEDDLGCE